MASKRSLPKSHMEPLPSRGSDPISPKLGRLHLESVCWTGDSIGYSVDLGRVYFAQFSIRTSNGTSMAWSVGDFCKCGEEVFRIVGAFQATSSFVGLWQKKKKREEIQKKGHPYMLVVPLVLKQRRQEKGFYEMALSSTSKWKDSGHIDALPFWLGESKIENMKKVDVRIGDTVSNVVVTEAHRYHSCCLAAAYTHRRKTLEYIPLANSQRNLLTHGPQHLLEQHLAKVWNPYFRAKRVHFAGKSRYKGKLPVYLTANSSDDDSSSETEERTSNDSHEKDVAGAASKQTQKDSKKTDTAAKQIVRNNRKGVTAESSCRRNVHRDKTGRKHIQSQTMPASQRQVSNGEASSRVRVPNARPLKRARSQSEIISKSCKPQGRESIGYSDGLKKVVRSTRNTDQSKLDSISMENEAAEVEVDMYRKKAIDKKKEPQTSLENARNALTGSPISAREMRVKSRREQIQASLRTIDTSQHQLPDGGLPKHDLSRNRKASTLPIKEVPLRGKREAEKAASPVDTTMCEQSSQGTFQSNKKIIHEPPNTFSSHPRAKDNDTTTSKKQTSTAPQKATRQNADSKIEHPPMTATVSGSPRSERERRVSIRRERIQASLKSQILHVAATKTTRDEEPASQPPKDVGRKHVTFSERKQICPPAVHRDVRNLPPQEPSSLQSRVKSREGVLREMSLNVSSITAKRKKRRKKRSSSGWSLDAAAKEVSNESGGFPSL